MSDIPGQLRYTKNHEWVRLEADGSATVGITDHAQELLGDVVFIELPEIGKHVSGGGEVGVVESVKAAADVYAPLSGVVTEVNQAAADMPESVNESPYDAWLFKMSPDNAADFDALTDAVAYRQMLGD
jgi:glycine cleavage system H protein